MPNITDQEKRAGSLLRYRRTQLDPAWRDRETFATRHNLSVRVINDLENGNRANFSSATIAAAEVAYRLVPGSLRRTLTGGDLQPATIPAPRREQPGRFQAIPGGGGQFRTHGANTRAMELVTGVLGPDAAELRAAIDVAGPGATGADIFADQTLAQIWDLRACSEQYRLMLMSTYLLRRRSEAEAATMVG